MKLKWKEMLYLKSRIFQFQFLLKNCKTSLYENIFSNRPAVSNYLFLSVRNRDDLCGRAGPVKQGFATLKVRNH